MLVSCIQCWQVAYFWYVAISFATCPRASPPSILDRPLTCSWVCPPDRLTVHPSILLSLVDHVVVNSLPPSRLPFILLFLSVRSVSQPHFTIYSQFTINIAIFFLHAWWHVIPNFLCKIASKIYHNWIMSYLRNLLIRASDNHSIILFSECSYRWMGVNIFHPMYF